jgi:hypothetical protein
MHNFNLITVMMAIVISHAATAQTESLKLAEKANGKWYVTTKFIDAKGETRYFSGRAQFQSVLKGQYVFEEFELDWDGGKLSGYGYIRYSPDHNRYELIQVDDFSKSSLLLVGTYDVENNILSFRPLEGYAQWGRGTKPWLEWDYYFYSDGTFRKELRMPDKSGKMVFHSDYTYTRRD